MEEQNWLEGDVSYVWDFEESKFRGKTKKIKWEDK